LNERFLNKKSTIISTNLSPKAIAETYTERIYSRLVGSYTFCKLYGPDIRFRNKFDRKEV
jgi:DNA replication protein DnaC